MDVPYSTFFLDFCQVGDAHEKQACPLCANGTICTCYAPMAPPSPLVLQSFRMSVSASWRSNSCTIQGKRVDGTSLERGVLSPTPPCLRCMEANGGHSILGIVVKTVFWLAVGVGRLPQREVDGIILICKEDVHDGKYNLDNRIDLIQELAKNNGRVNNSYE